MKIFICVWQKRQCRNLSQTTENERAEQIWSGWRKFSVAGTNLEWVEQIWSWVEWMWSEKCGE